MRYAGTYDPLTDTTSITLEPNCHLDADPLVRVIEFHNAEFDTDGPEFALACATLTRAYCGDVFELAGDGAGMSPDLASAIRTIIPQAVNVGPVNGFNRTLSSGGADVLCMPAALPFRPEPIAPLGTAPRMQVDWSGDFVDLETRSGAAHHYGRYITNAALVADPVAVSIAIGLLHGGSRCRTLHVPLLAGAETGPYESIVRALHGVGIELRLLKPNAPEPGERRRRKSTELSPAAAKSSPQAVETVPPQAIVMLSHLANERVGNHFDRLRIEVAGIMPAFLAFHGPATDAPLADIVLTNEKLERASPARYAAMRDAGGRINQGMVDLLYSAVFEEERLRPFEHLWFVEYDADFAGSWSDFFQALRALDADLIAPRVRTKADDPDWSHWKRLRVPDAIPEHDFVSAFIPVARISRRLNDAYLAQVASGAWVGHPEALLPIVALRGGMTIRALDGNSRFADRTLPRLLDGGSFGFRPPRAHRYFYEEPSAFPRRHLLYHPVKPKILAT